MKNGFYRPGEIDIREFNQIVTKMKSDLETLTAGQTTKREVKEYVEKLVHDGKPLPQKTEWIFWGLAEPEEMPADARVDFFYMPTYIAAAFMAKSILLYPELAEEISGVKETLRDAFYACTGREFDGHGYDALEGKIAAMTMFLEADIHRFLWEYAEICPHFTRLFHETMRDICQHSSKNPKHPVWYRPFSQDGDYTSELDKIVRLYETGNRYYLAYGSNMNKAQMSARCPTAEFAGTSVIRDYGLRFHHHANIESAKGERTPVLVWKLQTKDEGKLDSYEGFPRSYVKAYFTVKIDSRTITAMAYVMTPEKIARGKNQAPDKNYFESIAEGYRDEGLDETALEQALGLTQNQGMNMEKR
jgi:hypothetical protein